MSLMNNEKLSETKEALEQTIKQIEETTEHQAQLKTDAAELSAKIKKLNEEHESLTQDLNKIRNTQQGNTKLIQQLHYQQQDYEAKISAHDWEASVRKYITEYDTFYTFLEREIEKEQKRLQEVSPQRLEFATPKEACEKYKQTCEGRSFSNAIIDMRNHITHYDKAIRDMAETRANNRKVSVEQLRVPLQIISRCVANSYTTQLWYKG